MRATSLEHKTVRPGSLVGYSYYHSDRHQYRPVTPVAVKRRSALKLPVKWLVLALVVGVVIAVPFLRSGGDAAPVSSSAQTHTTTPKATTPHATPAPAIAAVPDSTNYCAGNTGQLIKVNITKRHLWACDDAKTTYDSPVITGMTLHPETVTPTGTYHIYSKQTNLTLKGSDAAGSWSDPVSFWMPFLNNQYGIYGFHDATWRDNSAFGNIDPNSSDASHGCVELPIASSKWLYGWAQVGTTLTIES